MYLAQVTPIENPVIPDLKGDPGSLFGSLFSGVIGLILIAGTIYALFMLLTGALQWISSGGDKANLENAQKRIQNGILGLIILFASWSVFILVLQFLGIIQGKDLEFILPKIF